MCKENATEEQLKQNITESNNMFTKKNIQFVQ